MVNQFEKETSPATKSSVFSCLTSWLKADNFEGKRRFINEQDGLSFLMRLVCEAATTNDFNPRMKAHVHRLLADFLVNDDGIFEDQPELVREYFCTNSYFVGALAQELEQADVNNLRQRQFREPLMISLFRMHQYKPELVGPVIVPALRQLKSSIEAVLADAATD